MTDAAEISQGFFGWIGEIALGDDGCFVAAQPTEYLGTALVIGASPGGVGRDDSARVAKADAHQVSGGNIIGTGTGSYRLTQTHGSAPPGAARLEGRQRFPAGRQHPHVIAGGQQPGP
jgi:hypothetical protein